MTRTLTRFYDVLSAIKEQALYRETNKQRPFKEVNQLRNLKIGAVRLPKQLGGDGLNFKEFFQLVFTLSSCDPNIAQIFRAHFVFVEGFGPDFKNLKNGDSMYWLNKVANCEIWGGAVAERNSDTSIRSYLTSLKDGPNDIYLLSGEKYYCTGAMYSDRLTTVAYHGENLVTLSIPRHSCGVDIKDDWDGFGQISTGSGTTRFNNVKVSKNYILEKPDTEARAASSHKVAFLQLYHLATLSGIGRSVLEDSIHYVRGRTRAYGIPGLYTPSSDPLMQALIGRISSLIYAAELIVKDCAAAMDEIADKIGDSSICDMDYAMLDCKIFQAQQIVIDNVLAATGMIFELGGARATSSDFGFDRHWRNARTVASHNPLVYREKTIGNFLLNGVFP